LPKGPNGERRPGDVIGAGVMVAKIATGEIKDNRKSGKTRSGKAGAEARQVFQRRSQRVHCAQGSCGAFAVRT
jgi:hypothetical protein